MTRKRLLAVAALAAGLAGITGCDDQETVVFKYQISADGSTVFETASGTDAKCAKEGSAWTHRMDNSNQRAVLAVARASETGRFIEIFDTDTCKGGIEIAKIGTYHSGGTPK
jgi:hypothetical protein